ncbi:MAG TPA: hypothetical protein IAA80_08135 [Candidatus Gallacutalibacter pullistercoris]|nr:hypothetical protein [Candidatus Gallacutalibacter pullistercoris]
MADSQEERQREEQLIREINRLISENNRLSAELNTAIRNVVILAGNLESMAKVVVRDANTLSSNISTVDESTKTVRDALEDLTHRYFLFKNLSTASKNLTQFTDEYYTRFKYYHKLRRITLGYVIGLDNAIISSEALRKEVEKIYLQNTEYWLAYAIAAVMLWASDEKEAARRAVKKSLAMDVCRSDVFFLLVNLRFDRLDAAKDWYLDYLDKVDLTCLGSEYQYLLQAYLAGLFGQDPEFESYVSENFQKSLARIDAVTVDFSNKFSGYAQAYAESYLHVTEQEFPVLHEVCKEYDQLKKLLSRAECSSLIAAEYLELAHREEEYSEDQAQRVENVLYDLINAYDDEEWKIIKQQKYNEAIIEAKGDLAAAKAKYDLQYENLDKKRSLADLMLDWAFSDDPTITNLVIKRFSISLMKEAIARGYERFAETYRKQEPQEVSVEIDGYTVTCAEEDYQRQQAELEAHYEKDRMKYAFQDQYIKLFTIVCAASLLLLVITAFAFNPVTLTIGVLGGIVGGFVLWRRLVEVGRILQEKKRLGVQKLKQAMGELASWRKFFRDADEHAEDVKEALEQF